MPLYTPWKAGLKQKLLASKPTYRPWSEIYPETGIPTGSANPYAILDELTEQFGRQPLTYQTDPITGQATATKSMARPEMPSEMRGMGFGDYFARPKSSYLQTEQPAGVEDLTSSWVLPKGALTGPTFTQRQPPVSDYERTMGHHLGIEGIGGQNIARASPLTHWPRSAFNVPMREAQAGVTGAQPTPAFGGTVSYAAGKWFTPPTTRWGTQPTYGKFPSVPKTPPGYGRVPAMGGFQPGPAMTLPTKRREPKAKTGWPTRAEIIRKRRDLLF